MTFKKFDVSAIDIAQKKKNIGNQILQVKCKFISLSNDTRFNVNENL